MAEPIRRGMELKIARGGEFRAACLGGSAGVSGDVLEGRDWQVEWDDVFTGKLLPFFGYDRRSGRRREERCRYRQVLMRE